MKKKRIVAIFVLGMVCIVGCGFADDLAEETKAQMEWADENGALGDGRGVSDDVKDVVYGLMEDDDTGVENGTMSSVSDAGAHYLGDTVPMEVSDEGLYTAFDLTVTGYDRIYNVDEEPAVAIYYTAEATNGDQIKFGNPYFTVYANNKYVEPGFLDDCTPFSHGVLMPGTMYEGVYIANIDPNTVSDIMIYCGDVAWVLQEAPGQSEETFSAYNTDYDAMQGLKYAGKYVLGSGSVDVSMYSSIEDEYVGKFTAILEDGSSYAGQLTYNSLTQEFEGFSEDGGTYVSLYFTDNGGSYTVELYLYYDNDAFYYGPFEMVEHFES